MTKIVVIGSVHLDIIGTIPENSVALDSIGNVKIGIGGTALNIALSLIDVDRFNKKNITFSSVINLQTFSGKLINDFLKIKKVNRDYIFYEQLPFDEEASDSVFLGFIRNKNLEKAVSSIEIEKTQILNEKINQYLKNFDAIVLDCNLPENFIKGLASLNLEKSYNRKIFVAATSEEKLMKLANNFKSSEYLYHTISMNRKEANYFKNKLSLNSAQEIREKINTQRMIITDGDNGFEYWNNAPNEPQKFDKPDCVVQSSLGAGDALFAGYIYAVINGKENNMNQITSDAIKKVLSVENPNVISYRINPNNLQKLWNKIHNQNKFVRISKWIAIIIPLLVGCFELVASFFDISIIKLLYKFLSPILKF